MSTTLHAFDYLEKFAKYPPTPVTVCFGDEAFLRRESLRLLRTAVLGEQDAEFSLTLLSGEEAELRDVKDELATVSMFSAGPRMVVVESADDFVSRFRAELEEYVAQPLTTGVLVLDVRTWKKNTRLYKALESSDGLQVECSQPTSGKIQKWLIRRTAAHHQAKLEAAAAELILDRLEPEIGLLDQELARLSLIVGAGNTISTEVVRENVGSWRTQKTWDMIDAATEGKAAEALRQLDRLILSGEHPIALMGQVASTLRKFAAAMRLIARADNKGTRVSLRSTLEQSGVPKFVLARAEKQLRQIGRQRSSQLYDWLIETDLALKGPRSSPDQARLVLEELILKLSKQADPRQHA